MKTKKNSKIYNLENDNVGKEIRNSKELLDNEKELLKLAKLDKKYKIEAWTALGTNNELGYYTHGFFRYFGKFPPVIATNLISEYTKENDIVFDPMCGSGTTGIEGLLLNRKTYINDINPLSILISKAKTTYLDSAKLKKDFDIIKKNYKPLSIEEYDYEPIGLKDYLHWFLPETCDSLRGIKYQINQIVNEDEQNFFMACFCAIIRNVSRATTQQGRLFLDVETAKTDAFEQFEKRVMKNIEAVSILPNRKNVVVSDKDIQTEKFKEIEGQTKLIIMHPPYFNSYKYSSINSLELSWINQNQSDIRKKEIHEFFKAGKKADVNVYIDDMSKSVRNIITTLKDDGVIAIMFGDTIINGNYINVVKPLIDNLDDILEVDKVILRVPKFTEASWAASQRRQKNSVGISLYDFIVVFRRKNGKN